MNDNKDKIKILIITCQGLPQPDQPTAGGSLRAFGLGEALKKRGHHVVYSVPQTCIDTSNASRTEWMRYSHNGSNLNDRISQIKPDIVIFGNWGLASQAQECEMPVIVDINGSLILENYFRSRGWPILEDSLAKIKTFSKVDLIIAGSYRQKMYLSAWCLMAGMSPEKIAIEVVPFSLPPEMPEPNPPDEPEFVIAGYNWPWIDGQGAIETVSHELERLQRGHLHIYTMAPPYIDAIPNEDSSRDSVGCLNAGHLPRVILHNAVSFDDLTAILSQSSVALDTWDKNLERELAFPTRTVVYLWSGLPVIVSPYSEISELIARNKAGWRVDPNDHSRLCELVRSIVNNTADLYEFRTNARRLISNHLTWDKTIEPIDQFCRKPFKNRQPPPQFTEWTNLQKKLLKSRKTNADLRGELKKSHQMNTNLQSENRLMGRVHRRPKGFAVLTSSSLFWLKLKRVVFGVPVLAYLFILISFGQFLYNLRTRWKR
ncbi:MAG: glycosyltransferase family 4 protein [Desulfobacterales bacterium]